MKILKFFVLILFATAIVANDSIINYLNASSNGDRIKIEWKSNDESNVQKFVVERTSKSSSYTKINEIDPKGSTSSYSIYDETALKIKTDELQGSTLYTYRIKIINKDQSFSYSNNVNVSHTTSGVKRTWGMIKEMFR